MYVRGIREGAFSIRPRNLLVNFQAVAVEAEQYLGMSMTYSLFEYVKENMDSLLEEQPDQIFDTKVSDNLAKLDLQ